MRKICLALPTNRPCAAMISAVMEEAAYAAEHFGVEVHLLILDSADECAFVEHAKVMDEAPQAANVIPYHLGEAEQRNFLQQVIRSAKIARPELILDLMLPVGVSYGACTNRAFLIAGALGCRSVHRRDSDSRFQVLQGKPVFPVHHELESLGKCASDAADGVSESALKPAQENMPVVLVGSSFVGELSVDIMDIYRLDPGIYHDVVSLWAPSRLPDAELKQLVEESFKGAGDKTFSHDHSTLTTVDPMRVDMCNVSFHQVYEDVPLPPATDTIGSDYFLLHLIREAALPGVLHNRNIVNFHTEERKTRTGFVAYQVRLTKFFLSMLYFHFIYRELAAAGQTLLDDHHRIRTSKLVQIVRASAHLDRAENVERLRILDFSYRKLGAEYAAFADTLTPHAGRFLDEAQRDIEDFALLIEVWAPLMRASKNTSIHQLHPATLSTRSYA